MRPGQPGRASPRVPDFLSLTTGSNPEGILVRLPEIEDVSIPVKPS